MKCLVGRFLTIQITGFVDFTIASRRDLVWKKILNVKCKNKEDDILNRYEIVGTCTFV